MSITIPDNIDISILLLNISNAKKIQRNQVIINNKKTINTYSYTHTDFNTHNINKQNTNFVSELLNPNKVGPFS